MTASRGIKIAWSKGEDLILFDNYPDIGCKGILELGLLPNRTNNSIQYRASVLGVRSNLAKWSPAEDSILRNNYPTMGAKGIQEDNLLPKRTVNSIHTRAQLLSVKYTNNRWEDFEDRVIIEKYPELGAVKLTDLNILVGRSYEAIRSRASTLGIKYLYRDSYGRPHITRELDTRYLYLLKIDDYLKVGHTSRSIEKRIGEIKSHACASSVTLLYLVEGTSIQLFYRERMIHNNVLLIKYSSKYTWPGSTELYSGENNLDEIKLLMNTTVKEFS